MTRQLARLRLEIRTLIGQLEALDKDVFFLEAEARLGELRRLGPVQVTETLPPVRTERRGRPRKIPAWAVPGMPEDMEHPLNLPSPESKEPDSSPQGSSAGVTPKKIFSNLRPKEAVIPRN